MRTRAPRAWVLNLDAEHELEHGARGTPPAALARAAEAAARVLARSLPDSDVVLGRDPDERARGLEGRAFCPTPSALARLARAGARIPEAPSADVLRRVNERGFAFAMRHLEGARRCEREDDVLAAVARPGRWLLKRGLASAGRGQRRIDAGHTTDNDRAWIRRNLPLYVEPRVEITLEVALHGMLARDGTVMIGSPTIQDVSAAGVWRSSRLARPDELTEAERELLFTSFEEVRHALHEVGYLGPFGIDAFRYRAESGPAFHPLGEINARYTMAFGTGMGEWP